MRADRLTEIKQRTPPPLVPGTLPDIWWLIVEVERLRVAASILRHLVENGDFSDVNLDAAERAYLVGLAEGVEK